MINNKVVLIVSLYKNESEYVNSISIKFIAKTIIYVALLEPDTHNNVMVFLYIHTKKWVGVILMTVYLGLEIRVCTFIVLSITFISGSTPLWG